MVNTEADFLDAIGLIDMVDNQVAAQAVKDALAECFEGKEKLDLWQRLTPHQRHKLAKPESLPEH